MLSPQTFPLPSPGPTIPPTMSPLPSQSAPPHGLMTPRRTSSAAPSPCETDTDSGEDHGCRTDPSSPNAWSYPGAYNPTDSPGSSDTDFTAESDSVSDSDCSYYYPPPLSPSPAPKSNWARKRRADSHHTLTPLGERFLPTKTTRRLKRKRSSSPPISTTPPLLRRPRFWMTATDPHARSVLQADPQICYRPYSSTSVQAQSRSQLGEDALFQAPLWSDQIGSDRFDREFPVQTAVHPTSAANAHDHPGHHMLPPTSRTALPYEGHSPIVGNVNNQLQQHMARPALYFIRRRDDRPVALLDNSPASSHRPVFEERVAASLDGTRK
jgi:hypothetical protein